MEEKDNRYLLYFKDIIIIIIIEGFIISVIGDYTEPLFTGTKFLDSF